jgi:transcriptional regulator with XRE-family HTH domain
MNDPAAIIRQERAARGLRRQRDLADLLGVTQPFVSQMERGLVDLPGEEVRARFLEHWGFDPFAERAAERVGKVSASEFSRRKKIDIHSILRLIAENLLPAHFLGDGLGYELDEKEAVAALDALERCRYEGCDEPATTETGCCGEHAQKQWALEARGTKRSARECERIREGRVRCDNAAWRGRIAAAKRGQRRDDVRERVAEMHADKREHRQWHLALLQGRAAGRRTLAKPTCRISPNKIKAAKNRVNGEKGAEGVNRRLAIDGGREGGAPPKATPQQVHELWRLHREQPERSPYLLSELVFGDRRYHMRVRRLGIS